MKRVIINDRANAEIQADITDTDTAVVLQNLSSGMTDALAAVDSAADPAKVVILTISVTPAAKTFEQVEVTAWDASNNTATVTRGQAGSTASAWTAGTPTAINLSSYHLSGDALISPVGMVDAPVPVDGNAVTFNTSGQHQEIGPDSVAIGGLIEAGNFNREVLIGYGLNLAGSRDLGPNAKVDYGRNVVIGEFCGVSAVAGSGEYPYHIGKNVRIGVYGTTINCHHSVNIGAYGTFRIDNPQNTDNYARSYKGGIKIGSYNYINCNMVPELTPDYSANERDAQVAQPGDKFWTTHAPTMVGYGNDMEGSLGSVCVGTFNTMEKQSHHAIAIGWISKMSFSEDGIMIGSDAQLFNSQRTTIIGYYCESKSNYALGLNAADSVLIGSKSRSYAARSVLIGYNSRLNRTADEEYQPDDSVVIGSGNTATRFNDQVVIGKGNNTESRDVVVLGAGNTANSDSICIGENNTSDASHGVAIGKANTVEGHYSGAIGTGLVVPYDAKNSFFIGNARNGNTATDLTQQNTLGFVAYYDSVGFDGTLVGASIHCTAMTNGAEGPIEFNETIDFVRKDTNAASSIKGRVVASRSANLAAVAVAWDVDAVLVHGSEVDTAAIVVKNITQAGATSVGTEASDLSIDLIVNANNDVVLTATSSSGDDFIYFARLDATMIGGIA